MFFWGGRQPKVMEDGFQYLFSLFFTPIPGEMLQFDLRIFFQMGWFNHQLAKIGGGWQMRISTFSVRHGRSILKYQATVDGRNPAPVDKLRLVVYLMIYKVLFIYTPRGCCWIFFQPSTVLPSLRKKNSNSP